jgi:hypothetical protein
MKKEGLLEFSDGLRLESDVRYNPGVDEGPGSALGLSLAAFEFDGKLSSKLNFSNMEAVKSLLLPTGITELKAITSYQIMQKQLLLVAIQTHQYAFDTWAR